MGLKCCEIVWFLFVVGVGDLRGVNFSMRGLFFKVKYYLMIDSELVLWGKGEKNFCEGSEKNLKPCAYKLWEDYVCKGMFNCVFFV